MTKFNDSRDPHFGYLILQDHGYLADDIPDHGRGSVVGVRVLDRATQPTEMGEWIEDEMARGPIGGGQFWARKKTNAGAWQFAWPVVITRVTDSGAITPPPTLYDPPRGEVTPPVRPPPVTTPGPTPIAGYEWSAPSGTSSGPGLELPGSGSSRFVARPSWMRPTYVPRRGLWATDTRYHDVQISRVRHRRAIGLVGGDQPLDMDDARRVHGVGCDAVGE